MIGSMYRRPEGKPSYYDDVSGEPLEEERTKVARQEDLEELRKHGAYTKVPLKECWEATGKQRVGTPWVEANKGDREKSQSTGVGWWRRR